MDFSTLSPQADAILNGTFFQPTWQETESAIVAENAEGDLVHPDGGGPTVSLHTQDENDSQDPDGTGRHSSQTDTSGIPWQTEDFG